MRKILEMDKRITAIVLQVKKVTLKKYGEDFREHKDSSVTYRFEVDPSKVDDIYEQAIDVILSMGEENKKHISANKIKKALRLKNKQ